jgi:hypothetical protein
LFWDNYFGGKIWLSLVKLKAIGKH